MIWFLQVNRPNSIEINSINGTVEKMPLFNQDYNDALTFSESDLKTNWGYYKEKFLEDKKRRNSMEKVVLDIPEEILISLKETTQEFSKDILMLAAVKLFELGKLSSGRAAQLAGMSRISFLQMLTRYKVPIFDLTEEELKQDMLNA